MTRPDQEDLLLASATMLAERLRRDEIRSRDLVDAHIARAEAVNPVLNAIVFDRYKLAREAADLVERVLAATPEPVVLSVLHRRVRELISVRDAQVRGESIQDAARTLKLKEYPARKLWEQARAWRPDELDAALEGLLELDAALKGEAASDSRRRRLAFLVWIAERAAR